MFYYQLMPNDIHQKDDKCWFYIDKQKYLFIETLEPVNSLNQKWLLQKELNKNKVPIHEFVLNKDQKLSTYVDNKQYVMLKQSVAEDTVSFFEICLFNHKTEYVIHQLSWKSNIDWKKLWISKIDYIEYQISQFGIRYPLLRECFDYFVGVAENAIAFSNEIVDRKLAIEHKRMFPNISNEQFYSPLELIVDDKIRDVCEYFKRKIFNSTCSFEELEYYLNYEIDQKYYINFYTRLLFPTPFFDLYEKIISGDIEEEKLNILIEKIPVYEFLLRKTYHYMELKVRMPHIEWLKKTTY